MPRLADFLEEDVMERVNNLEGRVTELEKSICRCGLGPRKEGEGEMNEAEGTGDESKDGTSKKDKKSERNNWYTGGATRREQIGGETVQYAKLAL